MSFELKILLYLIISTVAILSLIGNALEITTFLTTKNLLTSTNYFITSMAFSDVILLSVTLVLYSLSRLFVFENPLTALVCKLCTYFLNLSYLVSM